jgi:hypothetical protein
MKLTALKIAALTCILCQGGIAATLQRSGIQAQLSEKDIADAIELGTVGRPEPYVIRHMAPKDVPNTVSKIVASVYTPYIRVALVARAAANGGARMLPTAVGQGLIEPTALVVYRWTCCDQGISDATQQGPIRVAAPGVEGFLARYRLTQPLWVRYDVMSVLGSMGLGMAPPDSVAVAAYPLEAIKPGVEFVIYRDLDPESVPAWVPASKIRIGQLRPEELSHWR